MIYGNLPKTASLSVTRFVLWFRYQDGMVRTASLESKGFQTMVLLRFFWIAVVALHQQDVLAGQTG